MLAHFWNGIDRSQTVKALRNKIDYYFVNVSNNNVDLPFLLVNTHVHVNHAHPIVGFRLSSMAVCAEERDGDERG